MSSKLGPCVKLLIIPIIGTRTAQPKERRALTNALASGRHLSRAAGLIERSAPPLPNNCKTPSSGKPHASRTSNVRDLLLAHCDNT